MASESSPTRVLIVDRPKFSRLISKMFPSDRYWTDSAEDGLQAFKKLQDSKPDLLLI